MDASPLSKLSAEIRNIIYDMVVSEERERKGQDKNVSLVESITPPIAQVCQQIRNEVLLMCFDTTFVRDLRLWRGYEGQSYEDIFTNIPDFCAWLDAVVCCCQSVVRLKLRLNFDWVILDDEGYAGNKEKGHEEAMRTWQRLLGSLRHHGYGHSDRLVIEPFDPYRRWELEPFAGHSDLEKLGIPMTFPAEGAHGHAESMA